MLSNTHLDGAQRLAERIRQAVEALRISTQLQEIGTTISVGVAALEGSETPQQEVSVGESGAGCQDSP